MNTINTQVLVVSLKYSKAQKQTDRCEHGLKTTRQKQN